MIGKLEELTLLACIRSGESALASEIYARVCLGQTSAAFGAVYTTLSRLVKKEMVRETEVIDNMGRSRRGFSITGSGREALDDALSASEKVGGISWGGRDVAFS